MDRKLLTVTIPTWNRQVLLEELLSILIHEITEFSLQEKVEILISDNGSTDETRKVVKNLADQFSYINYSNNGINKGARFNVLHCMANASGKFLILLGDDDRPNKGALFRIINFLEKHSDTGSLIDSNNIKQNPFGDSRISLTQLLENFYYYIGNAGLFILKSDNVKSILTNRKYESLSPTWPQTQVIILSSEKFKNDSIYIQNLKVLTEGHHELVMIYTSYYLWRTTYIDFLFAIEEIKSEIKVETYLSAKKYFRKNINQLFFNILQCGVFLDTQKIRYKTGKEIFLNLNLVSLKEKSFLIPAAIILFLPAFFSRPLSNTFIFLIRGKAGLSKKNRFVEKEQLKRKKKTGSQNVIREFDFTNV